MGVLLLLGITEMETGEMEGNAGFGFRMREYEREYDVCELKNVCLLSVRVYST